MGERRVYCLREVADLLGISERTASELAQQQALPWPAIKVGNQWRFRRAEVDRWFEGRRDDAPRLRLVPRRRVPA